MQYLNIDNHLIGIPIIDILNRLKLEIHNGKLNTIKPTGSNIRVSCVNSEHKQGHEAKASADIYIGDKTDSVEYGWYKCFTCGVSCPFYHFVALCFECSDENAKKWLIDNFSDGTLEYDLDLPEINLNKSINSFLDESVLNNFQTFHPYMLQRKLTKKLIDLFEIKYDTETKSIVFPVRDEKNRLVMLTRRSVEEKRFMIDKEKEKPLYLLNYIIKNNIEKAMITEGQIDALTAFSYNFPCVATIGAISEHQIELLNKSGIRVLYSMFDNDEAGKRFYYKLKQNLRKDILLINVPIIIKGKKDINDLTLEEFNICIDNAEKNIL